MSNVDVTGGGAHPLPGGAEERTTSTAASTAGGAAPQQAFGSRGVARPAWEVIFWSLIAIAASLVLYRMLFEHFPHDHYVYLAHSLAHGRLDVDQLPGRYDVVVWHGHKYIPFGPFPAVLLIALLPLLDAGMDLGIAALLISAVNIYLLHRILGRMQIRLEARRWLLLLFFCGTVYFQMLIVPFSTWFAHVVVIMCLSLAINEMLGARRASLIGLYIGLAAASRGTAAFTLPFFLWLLWSEEPRDQDAAAFELRLFHCGKVILGFAAPVVVLLAYNYARFGSVFETGYGLTQLSIGNLVEARQHGLFSIRHVPKNLFMLLLQGPIPYPSEDAPVLQFPYVTFSAWGMGIFFSSPALLMAFRAPIRERFVQACWLATTAVLIPLSLYYGVGWKQFGYRYALDFMPFILLLTAVAVRKGFTAAMRGAIAVSVVINLWGAMWVMGWR